MSFVRLMTLRNIRIGGPWTQIRCISEKQGDGKDAQKPESDPSKKNDSSSSSSSSDDSESSDDDVGQVQSSETKQPPQNVSKNEAINLKLNQLLQSMLMEEPRKPTPSKAETLTLARPKQNVKKKDEDPVSRKVAATLGLDLVKAAVKVASTYGGDEQQTQAELFNQISKAASGLKSSGEKEEEPDSKTRITEQLRPTKSSVNLSELIGGMKIEHAPPKREEFGRAQQVRDALASQPRREMDSVSSSMIRRQPFPRQQSEATSRAGLNEGVPLGIFSKPEVHQEPQPYLKTWAKLEEDELKLSVTHPPANYFEELILWTNQGKLWHFPIDNQQGLEEEANVPFSEHVFLEHHLDDWCPKQGSIRHFMELVCVGLSKSPYLTVQEKIDHIAWYKDYFASKEALLKEVGAIPA